MTQVETGGRSQVLHRNGPIQSVLGFIGLGVMGEPICRNLASKSGRPVVAHDRVAETVDRLGAFGVRPAASAAAVAEQADVVFLALPSGRQVESVCRGPDGILENARPGQTIIDLGTSPVGLTRELADAFAGRGATFVDAPVARTRQAAEEGTLSIMVGASEETFGRVQPLLACFASAITLCGPIGSGQVVKILNNMVLFVTVTALSEALQIGGKAGVGGEVLFDALSHGSADSFALRNHGLKAVLPQHFPERSFSAEYALKDLSYAMGLAEELNCAVPCAAVVEDLLKGAIAEGWGLQYWPVISKVVEKGAR